MLGDEWLDWDKSSDSPDIINAGKSIFLIFSFIATIILIGSIFFILYLITPRLDLLHPFLLTGAKITAYFTSFFLFMAYIIIAGGILFEKNFGLNIFKKAFSVNTLLPLSLNIAGRFGISKDKLSHSFIIASNAIIRALKPGKDTNRILVLLPRCLEKQYLQHIRSFEEKYEIKVSVVSGGSRARELICEIKPHAVIGVACERDLLSGIRDISPKVPVIGIANERPEGPCKATTVDIKEIEDSIRFLLNK